MLPAQWLSAPPANIAGQAGVALIYESYLYFWINVAYRGVVPPILVMSNLRHPREGGDPAFEVRDI